MQVPKRQKEQHRKYVPPDDCHLTAEKATSLRRDLADLEANQRPQAVNDLSVAAAMGDLSENAAYSEAKGRLARIDGRIFGIKERLKNAIIIERGSSDGRACLGATVILRTASDEERRFDLVGPQEADPGAGRLSYQSPLGSLLVGKSAGERVSLETPRGAAIYQIIEVR
jgi:transcription elongation GreA/GreB family factor